jgi:hypothetical protein
VRVGKPGVHGSQTHLGPVAHEEEEERQPQEPGVELVGRQRNRRISEWDVGGGPREEDDAEKRERDPHRADEQILPRRFHPAAVAVEIDQRGGKQRRRLDCDPLQGEMVGADHDDHRQDEQVDPHVVHADIRAANMPLVHAPAEVPIRVDGTQQMNAGHDHQEIGPEPVEAQQVAPGLHR